MVVISAAVCDVHVAVSNQTVWWALICINWVHTLTCSFTHYKLHFTHSKLENTTKFDNVWLVVSLHWSKHQCRHFCDLLALHLVGLKQLLHTGCLKLVHPSDVWCNIECQFGKASDIVTVVVQYDGSQGDSCREYEQQLPITARRPPVILTATVWFLSKVGISQFELCPTTMDKVFWVVRTRQIPPTVGTGTLRSTDRVTTIGILWWVHLTWSGGYCRVEGLVKFAWSHW